MGKNGTQPDPETQAADLDMSNFGILELGRASAETRGCLGIFEDVVCQLQPPGIDLD